MEIVLNPDAMFCFDGKLKIEAKLTVAEKMFILINLVELT